MGGVGAGGKRGKQGRGEGELVRGQWLVRGLWLVRGWEQGKWRKSRCEGGGCW